MVELIQRLHETTTHLDLGLPGFSTQYSLHSQEHAAYADYASSKFTFLGHLIDELKATPCSIVIMAQSGTIQTLLEDYVAMKHVYARRHDRASASASQESAAPVLGLKVELLVSGSHSAIELEQRPVLIIAFDASFDAQDSQVTLIREKFLSPTTPHVPIIHLLVANSSEHIDACLPKSMPSPARLKLLVRATYQAQAHLGGEPTYVPDPSDEPEGRSMDYSDLQRAIRKSPGRKLSLIAKMVVEAALSTDFDTNWGLSPMPPLQLDEFDSTPSKPSRAASSTPAKGRARSRTPISRAATPIRKRLLVSIPIFVRAYR